MRKNFWLIIIIIYCSGIFIFTHSPVSTGEHTLSIWESLFSVSGSTLETINFISRKITHFVTFGLLGWMFLCYFGKNHYFYAWLAATIYGGLDEWHQTFIDGRMGTVMDACLNSLGAFTVLLLVYLFNGRK